MGNSGSSRDRQYARYKPKCPRLAKGTAALDMVASKLGQLISSPIVRNRCREIAERARNMDPLSAACKLIEDYIQSNRVSTASAGRTNRTQRQAAMSESHSLANGRFSDEARVQQTRKLKILLTSKLTYVPTLSGANKADRRLLEGLAERGHFCRAIVLKHAAANPQSRAQFLAELSLQKIGLSASYPGIDAFHHKGVEVHAVDDTRRLCAELGNQISQFEPDWIWFPKIAPTAAWRPRWRLALRGWSIYATVKQPCHSAQNVSSQTRRKWRFFGVQLGSLRSATTSKTTSDGGVD